MTDSTNPRRDTLAAAQLSFLTSLRGAAALLIVVYHVREHLEPVLPGVISQLLASGFLGVDFFFTLSGFILAWKYHADFERVTAGMYRAFVVRRIARIAPLHIVVMCVFIVVPLAHVLTGRSYDASVFSATSFFVKLFLVDAWGLGYARSWNVPSWSISAEFAAYLLFPVLVRFIARRRTVEQLLLWVSICAAIAVIWRVNGLDRLGQRFGDFALARCLGEFTLGMLVFFLWRPFRRVPAVISKLCAILAPAALVLLLLSGLPDYYFAPLLFSLVLAALLQFRSSAHTALEWGPIAYLGEISYSVYLNHYLMKYLMTTLFLANGEVAGFRWIAAYVSLTLGASALTYRFIETTLRDSVVRLLEPHVPRRGVTGLVVSNGSVLLSTPRG